jgi:hypothetical protein
MIRLSIKRCLFAIAFGFCVCFLCLWVAIERRVARCAVAADLIKPGMTEEEVERIMLEQFSIGAGGSYRYSVAYYESEIAVNYVNVDRNGICIVESVTKFAESNYFFRRILATEYVF